MYMLKSIPVMERIISCMCLIIVFFILSCLKVEKIKNKKNNCIFNIYLYFFNISTLINN